MFALCGTARYFAAAQALERRARLGRPAGRRSLSGRSSGATSASASARNRCEETVRTSCPDTPRTALSDETTHDRLAPAVLGGKPLEQGVGVLGEADLERADPLVRAGPVEDEEPARPGHADEAREPVDQMSVGSEGARVEQVPAVEQIERRVSQRWRLAS